MCSASTISLLDPQIKAQIKNNYKLKKPPKSEWDINFCLICLQFDVQRRNVDTRIDICCAGKPGLLLSTVSTLEALGLEIQQCVISCFNDFAMQASCSEVCNWLFCFQMPTMALGFFGFPPTYIISLFSWRSVELMFSCVH